MATYNEEEYVAYLKRARESEGFDVGSYPGLRLPGGIVPFKLDDDGDFIEELNDLCKLALEDYNVKENTHYEFVKLVKVNGQSVKGRLYYFTFEAKKMTTPSNSEETLFIFQAKVWEKICNEGSEVLLCRIKTS